MKTLKFLALTSTIVTSGLSLASECGIVDGSFVPEGFTCTWSDEFGGDLFQNQSPTGLDSRNWSYEFINVNNEQQVYTSRDCVNHPETWNTCVSDGRLVIQGRQLDQEITCPGHIDCAPSYGHSGSRTASYSSARLTSKTKQEWRRGYLEFRVRLPDQGRSPQPGSWPAVWTLQNEIIEGPGGGTRSWPLRGAHEFDILEWTARYNLIESNAIWEPTDTKIGLGPNSCNFFPEGGHPACQGPQKVQRDKKCNGQIDNTPYNATPQSTHSDLDSWVWQRHMSWTSLPEPHNSDIFGCAGESQFDHNGWYTYGYLWTKDHLKVLVDGELQHVLDLSKPGLEGWHDYDQFLIINMAYGGDLGCKFYHSEDNFDPEACLKNIEDWSTQTLEIDYIRLYQ